MWGDPSQAEVVDPVDFGAEDPRIYARQDGGAEDSDPDLGDFRDCGDARDWTSVATGVGYPGADESATWLQKRESPNCDPQVFQTTFPTAKPPRRRDTTRTTPIVNSDSKSH